MGGLLQISTQKENVGSHDISNERTFVGTVPLTVKGDHKVTERPLLDTVRKRI